MTLYKLFEIGELFELKRGFRHVKSERVFGNVPYYSTSDSHNGLTDMISNPKHVFKGNSLIVTTFGYAYYIPHDFTASDEITILRNKNINKRTALYLATKLNKFSSQFSYSYKAFTGTIKKIKVLLPVKSLNDTEPDWAYMEEYMKDIEKKTILKVKEENDREIPRLNELVGMNEGGCREEVEYAEFRVGDLFEVTNGQKFPKDLREVGGIPLISTTSRNNGISDHVNLPQHFETHKNIITIAYSGAVGETFYQANDVFVGETVMWLKAKEEILNKRNAHYVVAAIKKSLQEFNYGHKVKVSDVRDLIYITLPVNKENRKSPDWGFMEKYIGQIELKMRQPLLNS